MIIPNLAVNTEVIYVGPDGQEQPARIVRTVAPGQFHVATDAEGNHIANVTYSSEPLPLTFHFPTAGDGEADASGGKTAPKKPAPFKPGAGAAAAKPVTEPPTPAPEPVAAKTA